MTSRVLSRRGRAVAGVAVLLLVTGCGSGSDDPEAGGPGGEASSPTTPSPSVRVPEATPVVEPADGPLIRTEGATIRGLKGMKRVSDYGIVQGYRNDQLHLTFTIAYSDKPSLDAAARQHERIVEKREGADVLERVDDVVVGGKYNAFHFLNTDDPVEENHEYGLLFLDGSWIINIGFYNEAVVPDEPPLTAEEREEVTASILASFEPTFN